MNKTAEGETLTSHAKGTTLEKSVEGGVWETPTAALKRERAALCVGLHSPKVRGHLRQPHKTVLIPSLLFPRFDHRGVTEEEKWLRAERRGRSSLLPARGKTKPAEHGVSTPNGASVLIFHGLDWLSDWTELFWVAVKKNYFINYLYVLRCLINCVRLFAPHGLLQHTRLLCPLDSPGKNTGVGCHFLFQGIEPMSHASPALAGGFFTTSVIW